MSSDSSKEGQNDAVWFSKDLCFGLIIFIKLFLINKEEKRFLKVHEKQSRHKTLLVLAHSGAAVVVGFTCWFSRGS